LRKVSEYLSPEERKLVVVFGSSAIALHGVQLGRDVNDLDLFVSEATFAQIAARFPVKTKPGGDEEVSYINPCEDVEILKSFPGVTFENVVTHAFPTLTSGGFLVGALDDVKRWKAAQGREKDFNDIKAIDRHVQP